MKIKSFKSYKLFESNTQHERVIPRDFFNEAKLLKCMGMIAVSILDNNTPDGITISIEETGEPFDIILNETYSLLIVLNYPVIINGEDYLIGTQYNCKENHPLYVIKDDVEILVFDVSGEYSENFIKNFKID